MKTLTENNFRNDCYSMANVETRRSHITYFAIALIIPETLKFEILNLEKIVKITKYNSPNGDGEYQNLKKPFRSILTLYLTVGH